MSIAVLSVVRITKRKKKNITKNSFSLFQFLKKDIFVGIIDSSQQTHSSHRKTFFQQVLRRRRNEIKKILFVNKTVEFIRKAMFRDFECARQ